MPPIETLLTISQVARLIGVSSRTIWKMIADHRTPAPVHIGRLTRFRASEIDRWLRLGCPDREPFERGES